MESNHWIIRVSDGENLKRSKHPFWGVKRGAGIKGTVEKMRQGDVLWFLANKANGGKFIGMAEFTGFYDRKDEPLIQINTLSNVEQGWLGDEEWDVQIQYKNYYNTERQNIQALLRCPATIMHYETFKNRIQSNLYEHYRNFVYYAVPKEW
jgi:hypothetical protein